MRTSSTIGRYRSLPAWLVVAVVTAALLPLITFAALQSAFSARIEQSAVERSAVEQARRLMTTVDARLERTRGAAAALITTTAITEGDWPAVYQRAKEIAEQNPDWDSAIIWDRRTGQELIDTRQPFGPPRPTNLGSVQISKLNSPSSLLVEGVDTPDNHCRCILAHSGAGNGLPYILTVRLIPSVFQKIVAQNAANARMSQLVDARGKIVAGIPGRHILIGAPAESAAVRAIRSGSSGTYRSAMPDGTSAFSAYWKSPLSGWSAHVAFGPQAIEGVLVRLVTGSAIAVLASLLIAGAIVWLALRSFTTQRRLEEQETAALRVEAVTQLAVARDLHDGVLQFLTGLKMRLYSLRGEILSGTADSPEAGAALRGMEAEVMREQRELRRFIENLGPRERKADDEPSLEPAASMLSQRWGAKVSIQPQHADSLVPAAFRRDVEFIIREAVSNAVRHGKARAIDVEIKRNPGTMTIDIVDDGCGFPQSQNANDRPREGATPATIAARVKHHGGSIHIRSCEDGATLSIEIPVSR